MIFAIIVIAGLCSVSAIIGLMWGFNIGFRASLRYADLRDKPADDLPDCSGAGGGEWVDIMHIGV